MKLNKTAGALVGTVMALTPVAAKAQKAEKFVADTSRVAADTVRKSNWMKRPWLEVCPSFKLGETQNVYNIGNRAVDAFGFSYRLPKVYEGDKFRLGTEISYKKLDISEARRLCNLYNSPPYNITVPGYTSQILSQKVMSDFKPLNFVVKGLKAFAGVSNITEGGFRFNDSYYERLAKVKPSEAFANSLTGLSAGIGNETFEFSTVAGLKVATGEAPHPALFARLKMYAHKFLGFFTDLSIEKTKPTSVESGVIIRL